MMHAPRCATCTPSDRRTASRMAVAFAAAGLLVAASSAGRALVHVADVPSLYQAVNDAANAGALVVLGPGRYRLDPTQPNGGRLELQRDMALQGAPGDAQRTVIDASALPPSSYAGPFFATGAIRLGRGSNAVEWLAVEGALAGPSAIATDLVAPGAARVRIANVVVRNSVRGIDVRNIGAAMAGRRLEVELANVELFDHLTGAGQGLRFMNSGAPGAAIEATLRSNRSHGNVAGCIAANSGTAGASIAIRSWADRFDGNGNGCVYIAGIGSASSPTIGNLLMVEIHAGEFEHNTGPLPPAFPIRGGILVVGGESPGAPLWASGNTLEIGLWGTTMSDNGGSDVNAIGALTVAGPSAASDNVVRVELHGAARRAAIATTSSMPPDPASGNVVEVLR